MQTYAGIRFLHDVEGISKYPGGLSFTHSVAGHSTIQMSSTIGLSPACVDSFAITSSLYADLGIFAKLNHKGLSRIAFSAPMGISASLSILMNQGYTDIVQFGDLILRRATRTDWTEYTLSTRVAQIYDGTEALEGDPITGYYEKFRWYPDNDDDVKKIRAMAGKFYTLRVWGVPYRNVMLWGKLRIKQVRRGHSLWIVEGEFKQDTTKTGITT